MCVRQKYDSIPELQAPVQTSRIPNASAFVKKHTMEFTFFSMVPIHINAAQLQSIFRKGIGATLVHRDFCPPRLQLKRSKNVCKVHVLVFFCVFGKVVCIKSSLQRPT